MNLGEIGYVYVDRSVAILSKQVEREVEWRYMNAAEDNLRYIAKTDKFINQIMYQKSLLIHWNMSPCLRLTLIVPCT
jgi:hypothetical protein